VVRIDGRDFYLGKFGSEESQQRYDRLIAQWLANGRTLASVPVSPAEAQPPSGVNEVPSGTRSVNEVILAYWEHAREYYRKHGRPTGETDNIRAALRPLRQLYGRCSVSAFTSTDLGVVRESMISSGLSRKVINARINRVKRMFRWAAGEKLLSSVVACGLTN
jgi:hypothetical protein